jgi:hypothetical protein
VEGTGSYGVGLSRFLHDLDVDVVEVDRPNRQARRRLGKSDPVDAVSAARAALSGSALVTPKRRDGAVEQMRVLLVARRSARRQRIATLNQLRQLVFTAPDEIRIRYKDRYKTGLVTEAAAMRPRKGNDPVTYTTNVVIRNLARRIEHLNVEMRSIDDALVGLIEQTAPSLFALYGVGVDTAPRPAAHGTVLGAPVWCHPDPRRIRQDERPGAAEPWRRPASERGALPHRVDSHGVG